ncbi:MAG: hypothetical protein ACFFCD_11030 [Promethearchaeota archaeon]
MFSDWASRWEQLLLDQKSRMYIVQGDDGSLAEAAVKQENLDSKTVALIVDVDALSIWIWHGQDVGPKDKFVGARAARALRSVVGPKFRTMSPIGEGEESSDFLKIFESGGISKEPSAPPVQLEDIPEEPFISPVQLEDTASSKEVIEEVTNRVEIDTPVSPPLTKTTESKIEEPPEVSLLSLDPEKIRDLASLIISYTLKQIYRVEPITSRTKTHDLFRVSQEGIQLCKLKVQMQDTSIGVLEAVFDEKEEENAFYEQLNEQLHLLQKISLSI